MEYLKIIMAICFMIAIGTISTPVLSVGSFAIGFIVYIISELKERRK